MAASTPAIALFALSTLMLAPALQAQAATGDALQFLDSTGVDPDGTALARWTQDPSFTTFSVELAHMPAGGYDLSVGGISRGIINVSVIGQGKLLFVDPSTATEPLFDFTVFGQSIVVSQGVTVFFNGTIDQPVGGPGGVVVSEGFAVQLIPVGENFGVHGTLNFLDDGDTTRFSIDATGLPAGDFDLTVGDEVVGHMSSTGTAGATTSIAFADPGTPGLLPLDFDPLGATITLGPTGGGEPLLGAVMPASADVSGVPVPVQAKQQFKNIGKTKADALQVQFANVGLIVGATATARLTQDAASEELLVTAKGLPTGTSFDFVVDGTVRGSLLAAANGTATLDFQNPLVDGDAVFDFPVKGQLIEIRSGSEVVLAAFWPPSVQAALGTFKSEKHTAKAVKTNLFNVGNDLDATGTAFWEQKQNGNERLVIKVKDLPAGNYDVVVDGAVQGDAVLVVKKDGGAAEARFATEPHGAELPLDFTVFGTTLAIAPDNDAAAVQLQAVVE